MMLRLPAFVLALAALAAAPAAAADRSFSVSGFDRVRVDGPFRVRVATGVSPFAKASGKRAALDGVSIEVQGQTLIVRRNPGSWSSYPGESPGPVEISVGTHDLDTAWVNGAGALEIDKARGQSFDLSIQGPGTASIGQLDVDRLRVGMSGAGSAKLGGRAAEVTAIVRGTSFLDAAALTAKDVKVGAEGNAAVRLAATGTAKIDSLGTATVEITGGAACTVKATGSAVVSGCR
jgi:hypothetical protein